MHACTILRSFITSIYMHACTILLQSSSIIALVIYACMHYSQVFHYISNICMHALFSCRARLSWHCISNICMHALLPGRAALSLHPSARREGQPLRGYVCMYMCMYVCEGQPLRVYVCMYICMYVCICNTMNPATQKGF